MEYFQEARPGESSEQLTQRLLREANKRIESREFIFDVNFEYTRDHGSCTPGYTGKDTVAILLQRTGSDFSPWAVARMAVQSSAPCKPKRGQRAPSKALRQQRDSPGAP